MSWLGLAYIAFTRTGQPELPATGLGSRPFPGGASIPSLAGPYHTRPHPTGPELGLPILTTTGLGPFRFQKEPPYQTLPCQTSPHQGSPLRNLPDLLA
jgi:hypothetical protein